MGRVILSYEIICFLSFASFGLGMVVSSNKVPKDRPLPPSPSTPQNCSTVKSPATSRQTPVDFSNAERFWLGDSLRNSVAVQELKNCSDTDVMIQRLPLDDDYWKNQVIIGCTFAVAIEILIVALMVMYWRQIRWTLRKLTCPCDSWQNRHTPMHRREPDDVNFDSDSDDSAPPAEDVQIYMPEDDYVEHLPHVDTQSISDSSATFSGVYVGSSVEHSAADTWDFFASSSANDEDQGACGGYNPLTADFMSCHYPTMSSSSEHRATDKW